MQRTASRLKSTYNCKIPRSAQDIKKVFENSVIYEKYALNLRKSKPFYIDSVDGIDPVDGKDSSFTIFASHQIIDLVEQHILPKDRKYLMDGTFDVCPIGCHYQLLVIYIEFKNDVS